MCDTGMNYADGFYYSYTEINYSNPMQVYMMNVRVKAFQVVVFRTQT